MGGQGDRRNGKKPKVEVSNARTCASNLPHSDALDPEFKAPTARNEIMQS